MPQECVFPWKRILTHEVLLIVAHRMHGYNSYKINFTNFVEQYCCSVKYIYLTYPASSLITTPLPVSPALITATSKQTIILTKRQLSCPPPPPTFFSAILQPPANVCFHPINLAWKVIFASPIHSTFGSIHLILLSKNNSD